MSSSSIITYSSIISDDLYGLESNYENVNSCNDLLENGKCNVESYDNLITS